MQTSVYEKRIVIVSAGEKGQRLFQKLRKEYVIVGFVDNDGHRWGEFIEEGIFIYSFSNAKIRYRDGEVDCFLFPAGFANDMRHTLYEQLIAIGVRKEDIYMALEDEYVGIQFKRIDQLVTLPYLEIPLVEHCNLNCKGCSHFSPMAEEKEYDFDVFKRDIHRMKSLIDTIPLIRLLGGEPLLNHRLNEFVKETRREYPEAEIRIVTNGLLLKSMSLDFWNTVKENDAVIQLTMYPVLFGQEEDIFRLLNEKMISYYIFKTNSFRKPIRNTPRLIYKNLPKDWKRCHCTNLYNGKVSACAMVMFIELFNKKFNCKYPSDGLIDLYEDALTGKGLIDLLGRSIPFCDYCELAINDLATENTVKNNYMLWGMTKKGEESKNDWVQPGEQNG